MQSIQSAFKKCQFISTWYACVNVSLLNSFSLPLDCVDMALPGKVANEQLCSLQRVRINSKLLLSLESTMVSQESDVATVGSVLM